MLLVGCASSPTFEPLPCPTRPVFEELSLIEQSMIPPDIILRLSRNSIKAKKHIVLLEELSGCAK